MLFYWASCGPGTLAQHASVRPCSIPISISTHAPTLTSRTHTPATSMHTCAHKHLGTHAKRAQTHPKAYTTPQIDPVGSRVESVVVVVGMVVTVAVVFFFFLFVVDGTQISFASNSKPNPSIQIYKSGSIRVPIPHISTRRKMVF